MDDCIFCKIARHQVPAQMLHEDDQLFAIRDIAPKAPVHLLVIAKEHIPSINELAAHHRDLIADMVLLAQSLAQSQGISASGYKLVWNVGVHGGQTVPHIHLHVLGGKQLQE